MKLQGTLEAKKWDIVQGWALSLVKFQHSVINETARFRHGPSLHVQQVCNGCLMDYIEWDTQVRKTRPLMPPHHHLATMGRDGTSLEL